jgi:hypothetical protein
MPRQRLTDSVRYSDELALYSSAILLHILAMSVQCRVSAAVEKQDSWEALQVVQQSFNIIAQPPQVFALGRAHLRTSCLKDRCNDRRREPEVVLCVLKDVNPGFVSLVDRRMVTVVHLVEGDGVNDVKTGSLALPCFRMASAEARPFKRPEGGQRPTVPSSQLLFHQGSAEILFQEPPLSSATWTTGACRCLIGPGSKSQRATSIFDHLHAGGLPKSPKAV